MALQFQDIPLSFGQGLDTKNDPKQLALGKLVTLANGQFQVGKKISKRPGFSVYTQNIQGGGTISSAIGVATFQNELNLLDGANLYSYSPGLNAHVSRGAYLPVRLSTYPVVRNTHQQTNPDSAYHSATGLTMFVYSDTFTDSGGAHTYCNYTIIDTQTGTTVVKDQQLTTTATVAKVLCVGSYFVAIYYDGTTLYYKSVLTSAPQSLSAAVSIATLTGTVYWDACIQGTTLFVGYSVPGATQVGFNSLSSSLVLSGPYTASTSEIVTRALSIRGDGTNIWCAYAAGQVVRLLAVPQTLSGGVTLSIKTIESLAAGLGAINLGIAVISTTAAVIYEVTNTSAAGNLSANRIRINTCTTGGVVGTAQNVILQMGIASKPFIVGSTIYLLAAYGGNTLMGSFTSAPPYTASSIEPTYFLINTSGTVIAKLAQANGGGYRTQPCEVLNPTGSQYSIPYLLKDDLSASGGSVFFLTGVQSATFDFSTSPIKAEAGSNLHLTGGQTWMYDGANVVEHGFHLFPENIEGPSPDMSTLGAIGLGYSGATSGKLQYVAVYEWSDNLGQLHRSSPSLPFSVSLPPSGLTATAFTGSAIAGQKVITSVTSSGPTTSFADFYVGQVIYDTTLPGSGPTFPTGSYITAIDSVNSKLYVNQTANTTAAGHSFSTKDVCSCSINVPTLTATLKAQVSIALYRTTVNGTLFYRVSSLTAPTYNDKTTDFVTFLDKTGDSILVGNEQLYTTGEVENIGAPAFNTISTFKNRVVGIPSENPYTYWFSKEIIPGSPVEFSDLFTQNVTALGGPLVATAQLDDKLVLFKRSRVLISAGDGPTASGLNNDFLDPQLVSADTGCSNAKSVVITPVGVMYQSPKGIYLLDRSLTNHYIGSEVEAFNTQTVTSAQLLESYNQVCFTLNTGTILVYDYFAGQWSTYTVASAGVDSVVYSHSFAFATGAGVVNYQNASFSDNGTVVPLSLKTGWINLAGIQNLVRLRELMLVGEYKSPHTLTINIYTDYSTSIAQTVTIPVLSDPGLYQFKVAMKVQKIEALQIEIIESQAGTGTEGFNISAISFRAGLKQGLKNLKSAQAY